MFYDETKLKAKLAALLSDVENEVVEFKEASSAYPVDDIGRYFSALSNEAKLRDLPEAWMLFGVDDSGRVCGSNFRNDGTGKSSKGLLRLKHEIAEHTNDRLCFVDCYEMQLNGKRVVALQIPAGRRGVPTTWKKAAWERVGDRLEPLSLPKLDAIRAQSGYDWSGEIARDASSADFDVQAVVEARARSKARLESHAAVLDGMGDEEFLEKIGAMRNGAPTNAGLLLLGKEPSPLRYEGLVPGITWTLYDSSGAVESYEHINGALLLSVDRLVSRVRNVPIHVFVKPHSLTPEQIMKYDPQAMRELLYNCIAHQDYSLRGRINVLEYEDRIEFLNEGDFIPLTIDRALAPGYKPSRYQNPALCQMMISLGLIDTVAMGIPRVFAIQQERCMPLPDYDLSEPNRVRAILYGRSLDANYAYALGEHVGLPIAVVRILDKIQKGRAISEPEFDLASEHGLISGTADDHYILVSQEAEVRTGGPEDLGDAILEVIRSHDGLTRAEIADLLPEIHSMQPGDIGARITYQLRKLSRSGLIEAEGDTRSRRWRACTSGVDELREISA